MASKYEIITALYRESVKGLAKNHHTWTAFLHSACYNYRLPFDEQVLIHAQRPDATAVLEIEGKNGWNQKFGRWVNRYATGIAVFDRHHAGRQRLKYYFDISDTHESRFARQVPIWEYKPEYEAAVIEALENRFGELRDKSDLQSALHSVAKNAVEDNLPDYLSELIRYRADSFLEDYDDLNVEVIYRRLLENSVAYMLMSRCGLDVDEYFEFDDFNDVINFNSPDTMNTLGVSTSDIAENCLGAIALTVRNLQREEKKENRTFAENAEKEYPIVSKPKTMSERSIEDGTDLHDEERLSSAEPVTPAGAGGSPWEIRIASQKVSATEPQGEVHKSADIGQAERALDGSGQDGKREDGTLGSTDGTSRGHHGGDESHRSDEMGGTDEQHPNVGGGASAERADLQINDENAGGDELPAFLDERLIMGIIANKDDDLKFKKHQIELFFSVHTDPKEQAEYLKSAYHDRYTEVILDGGVRCGYKPQEDGLLMWEGAYLSRTKESVFSWDCIVGFTDQLIKKKEYSPGIINRRTKKLPPQDSNQLTLFDVFDMGVADTSEETPQLSLFPKWEASQQIIDETLCIGANERKSLLDICARFMKDLSVEENAKWLKEHYGTSGTGFFFEGRRIAVWYDENGIRIGEGDTAQRSTATVVTWEQAAKRIRELLDLGRYMPQSLIDKAADYEYEQVALNLLYITNDFSDDNAPYNQVIQGVAHQRGGYPVMTEQLSNMLKDQDVLAQIVKEWEVFTAAHKENPDILRFRYRPQKWLERLRNLQREPVIFRAAEGFDPKRERFITKDELDRLLRGSERRSDYRLGVYSFFRTHKDAKEREKYLREKFGTGGGTYDGNAHTNHDGKGFSFSRGDIMSPFAKITLSWAQVTKRITELYNRNSFLTEQDKEGMEEYELRQLGHIVHNGFFGASDEHPKPFGKEDISDYWKNVNSVAEQLKDPDRAEVIYTTMLLPLWESTLPNDRYYDYRKKAIEALQQYRDGEFSVFGNDYNMWLRQLDRETNLYSLDELYVITDKDGGSSVFEIVAVRDGHILYTFPDMPEQEPVAISIEEFERNLEKGIIRIKEDEPQSAEPEKPMNPILKRLNEQREKYPDAILLLRVGDFYEAFDEDAHTLAKVFDYTLTSRPLDNERKAMVGFPQHIFEKNIDKLMKTGATVVVNYPDGKTDIYPEPVQSKETDDSNREVDTLCKILDRLGIDDITIEYENGELVARDEDNVWYSKQLYDFLADEAFVYTEDGVLGVEDELLADFAELAKRYGIEIPTHNSEKEHGDVLDDVDPAAIREKLAQSGIVNGEVVDENALNNSPFIRQVTADTEAANEVKLAPPKPRKERVRFTILHPEIPAEQRRNFRITDPELGYGTASEKYAANVAAIRLLKKIESEERLATPDEQEILSRYVGWGGLADCFKEEHSRYNELKSLLEPDEYAAARASSLTAFYTSPVIVEAMYKALGQMGFKNGNLLEPACGVGNFIGMLPEGMTGGKAYGVELDSISGRIAQQLYQNSNIAVNGFEKVEMPDSFFDVAIGNVPFGDLRLADRKYDKHHWLIHDYFFGKTLDKVRPGGIIAFITSKGTMDKESSAVRKYLAQRADLIGAIRLPNTAFKKNAGTEVTSDIIFLQKRDRIIDIEPDWVHLNTDENGIKMNSYFVQHPEMVLGDMVMESSRFGMESTCRPYEDADLGDLLNNAISNLHAELTDYEVDELSDEEDLSIPADPNVRNFSYTVGDGKLYFRENSRMHPANLPLTTENRVRGMILLRDCVRQLIEYQTENYPDEIIKREQEKLNTLYDNFVKKYGRLFTRGNNLAFRDDSSYCLLCSLEVLDNEGNFERKADMFTKRTIKPHEPVTKVDTSSEALAVSISEKACVDLEYMSELSGKTEKELISDLKGVIYRDIKCPINVEEISTAHHNLDFYNFVTADEYLSGNVRNKLKMARALCSVLPAEKRAEIEHCIPALEAVQPEDLSAGEISVHIGTPWIPPEIYQQFMFETFGTNRYAQDRMGVLYSRYNGTWNITNKSADSGNIKATTTYGTRRINAYHIFEQCLNQKDVRIFDTVIENGKEKPVLNKKETAIAQDRQELIKQKFVEWIWRDIDRREMLCTLYNETYNSIRPREYDGQHIRFTGMNPEISLRPHQINAIAHILYGGNTLLAHEVGAGKTFEMVAAVMELKRLGLCNKSMIVVPNHITEQWAAEWLQLYPAANVLIATERDFEKQNRRKLCARIATGDYDAVIIGHSQLQKIPMSKERQQAIIERQIEQVMIAIQLAKKEKAENFTVKQMERTRKSLETRLERLNDIERDDTVTFEELGVDRLFIDESHYFKNLFLATKMRNVGGIAQTEAQKSSDLFTKCQYLDEITEGRGVIFATGTPISNSMVELYTIQRYLQYGLLDELGLQHFDDWAANYGETTTTIELSPEGSGYRPKTRFSKFINLPELMAHFKMCADIQTADMLKLPVPEAIFHNEVIKPSDLQKEAITGLAERAEAVRGGNIDPSVDNMLKITNDGRKLALDMRLFNPLAPDDENGKVATCARNVFRIWDEGKAERTTQLVFCDLSTPKGDGSFNVYDDLKQKLVERGIPEEEIAFIHDANTDARKKELFAKVRSGQVRILMGSTPKMGAGTNVQDRLVALHDLDCPWRPSDLAQRLGRIVRQGNRNKKVDIFRYVTEGTFDAYLYQLVENKQKFIAQIMTSKAPVRIASDVDETALNYAEIKALATGNPLIIEKCTLDMEVSKLNMLKASYLNQKYALEELVLRKYPADMSELRERIAGYEKDLEIARAHPKIEDGFTGIVIMGVTHTEKETAGKSIIDACTRMTDPDAIPLGEYRGFAMTLSYDGQANEYRITLKGALSHTVVLGSDIYGNITRMDNRIDGIEEQLKVLSEKLADTQTQLENARTEMEAPFAREAELAEKTRRLQELNVLLNLDAKDKTLMADEPDEGDKVTPRKNEYAR